MVGSSLAILSNAMLYAVKSSFLSRVVCIASTFVILLLSFSTVAAEGRISLANITFLDAGEGDAILLQSGGENVLIDVGNPRTGHSVLKQLEARRVKRLKALILTHPHPDHFGGIFEILPRLEVPHIHDNGEPLGHALKEDNLLRWYHELFREDPRYQVLMSGSQLQVGRIGLKVLSSCDSRKSPDWNTNSLVVMASVGKFRLLLMGDGNAETERWLIKSGAEISADVLKAGHHGAADTGTLEFLKAVDASTSIVSVNRNNSNGYPSQETVRRMSAESRLYRTDQHGAIALSVFGDGTYKISTEKAGR